MLEGGGQEKLVLGRGAREVSSGRGGQEKLVVGGGAREVSTWRGGKRS